MSLRALEEDWSLGQLIVMLHRRGERIDRENAANSGGGKKSRAIKYSDYIGV